MAGVILAVDLDAVVRSGVAVLRVECDAHEGAALGRRDRAPLVVVVVRGRVAVGLEAAAARDTRLAAPLRRESETQTI